MVTSLARERIHAAVGRSAPRSHDRSNHGTLGLSQPPFGDNHILETFLARLQSSFLRCELLVAYACGSCFKAVDWYSSRDNAWASAKGEPRCARAFGVLAGAWQVGAQNVHSKRRLLLLCARGAFACARPCGELIPLAMPSTVRPLLAGRFFFVAGADACQFGTTALARACG